MKLNNAAHLVYNNKQEEHPIRMDALNGRVRRAKPEGRPRGDRRSAAPGASACEHSKG